MDLGLLDLAPVDLGLVDLGDFDLKGIKEFTRSAILLAESFLSTLIHLFAPQRKGYSRNSTSQFKRFLAFYGLLLLLPLTMYSNSAF